MQRRREDSGPQGHPHMWGSLPAAASLRTRMGLLPARHASMPILAWPLRSFSTLMSTVTSSLRQSNPTMLPGTTAGFGARRTSVRRSDGCPARARSAVDAKAGLAARHRSLAQIQTCATHNRWAALGRSGPCKELDRSKDGSVHTTRPNSTPVCQCWRVYVSMRLCVCIVLKVSVKGCVNLCGHFGSKTRRVSLTSLF